MGVILDESRSAAIPLPAARTLHTATCLIGDRQPMSVSVHYWVQPHGEIIVEGATWGDTLLERHCFSEWQVACWDAQIRTQRACQTAGARTAAQCLHEALLADCT